MQSQRTDRRRARTGRALDCRQTSSGYPAAIDQHIGKLGALVPHEIHRLTDRV